MGGVPPLLPFSIYDRWNQLYHVQNPKWLPLNEQINDTNLTAGQLEMTLLTGAENVVKWVGLVAWQYVGTVPNEIDLYTTANGVETFINGVRNISGNTVTTMDFELLLPPLEYLQLRLRNATAGNDFFAWAYAFSTVVDGN